MTGFAFYSCDDVVDNPAQDPAQSWNYSVSVKFDAFDFTEQPIDPVTTETNVYEVPTTLYVLNEQGTLMGTITTEAAPAADSKTYATYAGTLTGSIGNNLIITTKIGNDLAKQDGTLASAIKNGIVQTAEVPIKIYNANSGTLTTASAKMENKAAILWVDISSLNKGDEVKIESENFTTEDNAISFTLSDADTFNPNSAYVAIPADTKAGDYTLSSDTKDGRVLNAALEAITFKAGEINTDVDALDNHIKYDIPFKTASVDLTKYWAAYKEATPTATSCPYFINDSKGTLITQSSSEYVPIDITTIAAKEFTLKNVNVRSIRVNWTYNTKITLEGDNIINNEENYAGLQFNGTELTITGTGSLETTGKNYGIDINNSSWADPEDPSVTKYGQLIIDENVKVTTKAINNRGIYVRNYTTLDIKDGATFIAIGNDGGIELGSNSTFNIGKATIESTATGEYGDGIALRNGSKFIVGEATITTKGGKNGNGIWSYYASWDIKDKAKIYTFGGKAGRGIYMEGDGTKTIKIGKNVTMEAQGAPVISEDALGYGMYIINPGNITIGEGTTIKATGADRCGLYIETVNIDIAEGATIEAIDALSNAIETANATITGKGKILANQAGKNGIAINSGTLTLNGATIEATGGAGKAAIQKNGASILTIGTDVIKVKATAGSGAKCIAEANDDEAKIDDLVADKTKFIDDISEGVRTITPKAE